MLGTNGLTTTDILDAFTEEISTHQGKVTDTFHDGQRLLARAVLPREGKIQPKDRLQAGVALKASEHEVCIHPYTFRLVCSNGAVMAQTAQSRGIADFYLLPSFEAISQLRQTIAETCEKEAFERALKDIRSSRNHPADMALGFMAAVANFPKGTWDLYSKQIMERFFAESDRSQFGLMNAVTSVARDTADPEARWNLEELGGAIPIAVTGLKPRPRRPASAKRNAEVLVG